MICVPQSTRKTIYLKVWQSLSDICLFHYHTRSACGGGGMGIKVKEKSNFFFFSYINYNEIKELFGK